MNEVLKAFIEFIAMFIVVFIVYKIFYKRKKDFSKLKDRDEIRNFVLKYDIDVRKINYNRLLNVMVFINSFIIAFAATVITRIDSFIWSILVCLVIVMVLMYAFFEIAGRYFKKEEAKYKEVKVEDAIKEVVKDSKKKTTKRKKAKKNV